jgi:hypothetical protein
MMFIVLSLSEPILHPIPRSGIMPRQCTVRAGNEAGPTLQAALVLRLYLALSTQRVHVGRADVQTAVNLALGLADLLVDSDVRLFINLEDVQA